MGTIPNPKMTVSVQMVPQPEPEDSLRSRELCASKDNKLTLDLQQSCVSAPAEESGNLCLKTSISGMKTFPDNGQPNRMVASNAFTSTNVDHKKSTLIFSIGNQDKTSITFSSGDHKQSTFTSSTGDHKKSELLSEKDVETYRDPMGRCVSDVIKSHEDQSAGVRVLPTSKKEDTCKTSLSGSVLTSPKTSLMRNDTRDEVKGFMEVLVQSRVENSTRDASEDPQTCDHKADQIQRSDYASHPKLAAPMALTTKQETASDVQNSSKDILLSVQSKYCKNTTGLHCVSASNPAQTGSHLQTSKQETTGYDLANIQQVEHENPGWNKAVSVGSAPTHKVELNPQRKKAGESESPLHKPLSTQSSITSLGVQQMESRASKILGVVPEENQKTQQGYSTWCKEAATMTISMEHCSSPKHSYHDAGVQAVASVCSRSIGTSPGLLSRGTLHEPNSTGLQGGETLSITCQRNSGSAPVYQITMDDTQLSQGSILSDVCSLSSQIHIGTSQLTSKQVYNHLPEQAILKAGLCNSQTTGIIYHSDPIVQLDGVGLGVKPKKLLYTVQTGLLPLKPVYQINIESCSQSIVTSNISLRDKESLVTDSKYQCKTGADCERLTAQGLRRSFPGTIAPNDSCQATDMVAFPTHLSEAPAVRLSSSQVDGLMTAASSDMTVAKSEKDDEEASSQPLIMTLEDRQTMARKNKDLKQHVPREEYGHICKSNRSEDPAAQSSARVESEQRKINQQKKKEQPSCSKKVSKQNKAKSMHDVVWDEQGMTWEVYGASADPESLGFAIQNHLQSKIKEQEKTIITQVGHRRSVAPGSPVGKRSKRRQQNMFRSLLQNVRRPKCCVHPPPSSVLE